MQLTSIGEQLSLSGSTSMVLSLVRTCSTGPAAQDPATSPLIALDLAGDWKRRHQLGRRPAMTLRMVTYETGVPCAFRSAASL